MRGTSRGILYEELGLESLQLRLWFKKLSCFYILFNSERPHYYLFKLISSRNSNCVTRNIHNIPFLKTRHTFLKNSLFPSTIIEWNKLDHNITISCSFNIFRKSILKFIRPSADSLFNWYNPKWIKFITSAIWFKSLMWAQFEYIFEYILLNILLNIFVLLKDLMNHSFNENIKFSNKVMNQYILHLLH